MSDQDQRGLRCGIELKEQIDDPLAGDRIQISRGLVGEQHRRITHRRPRHGHPLLFTARELPRIMTDPPRETDASQDFLRTLAGVGPAAQFKWQHDIFQSRQRRHQMKGLEHEPHLLRAQARAAVFIECRQVGARQPQFARTGRVQSRQQCQQCGFAGPGGPGDRNALPRAYCK